MQKAEMHTLAEVLELLNEGTYIKREHVPERVQNARVWHAIVSFPGCLGDNHAIARSREAVLASVEYWLDEGREYSARYVRGQLRRHGIVYLRDDRVITLERHTVGECL